jgi:hypothetical protein
MAYSSPEYALAYNKAKARALSRLKDKYPDDYRLFLEEEMLSLGWTREERGPHDRGGKGPMIWRRPQG